MAIDTTQAHREQLWRHVQQRALLPPTSKRAAMVHHATITAELRALWTRTRAAYATLQPPCNRPLPLSSNPARHPRTPTTPKTNN